jgi:serine O-acetyltransferase
MIGSGAKVLGPLNIGDNSRIAAGAVVLSDIPANSTAVGVPARVVKRDGIRVEELDQVHIPDPVAQEIARLETEITELKEELNKRR